MKRIYLALITVLIAITLTGCGNAPKDTAENFMEHLANGEILEAKEYATQPTGQLLDMAQSMGAIKIHPDFEFIYVDQEINGNRAEVTFRESENGPATSLDLVKINKEWKVHIEK